MKTQVLFLFLALFTLTFTACDDDEGVDINEQELITTVEIRLTEFPDSTITTFAFRDTDGAGGNAPEVDEIKLKTNTSYVFNTIFLDESDPDNVTDFSSEIVAENLEHLVCYSASGSVTFPAIADKDSDNQPLGLAGVWTTSGPTSGTLQVSLKHQPNKSDPDPCATGETDVEVTFPVVVE